MNWNGSPNPLPLGISNRLQGNTLRMRVNMNSKWAMLYILDDFVIKEELERPRTNNDETLEEIIVQCFVFNHL